ncbi:MAG TPA: MarR family transcriptional regulator [Rhodopila sp.]|jgi:DNA-binding MarR family transcriptional regulator|nr:MarR family transcriptional regulator [Rhodopila sp.]
MLKPKPRAPRFIPPAKFPPPTPVVDLGDAEMRLAQDLLFFAYRDFTNVADQVLDELGLGRAHHRALHYIGRNPGITVSGLLAILRITKQSLARVLNALVDQGYVAQAPGFEDRRLRLLTLTGKGQALEQRLFQVQRDRIAYAYRIAGPQAVVGFRAVMRAVMDHGARAYMDGTGSAEDA